MKPPTFKNQLFGILAGLLPVVGTYKKTQFFSYFIPTTLLMYSMASENNLFNLLKVLASSMLITCSILIYRRRLLYRTFRKILSIYLSVIDSIPFVSYQEQWPQQFEDEKKRIEDVLSKKYPYRGNGIVMIGSTSIKGISIAKNMHDLILGLKLNTLPEELVKDLESLGYDYLGYSLVVPDGGDYWFFYVYPPEEVSQNGCYGFTLHVCLEHAFSAMNKFVAFSEYCNTFPEEKKLYEETKKEI